MSIKLCFIFMCHLPYFEKQLQLCALVTKLRTWQKIDIESAYRCIPVRPADWSLQGMQWQGKFYFDIVMQFGLASATAIFEWYSSAAEYIAKRTQSIEFTAHYVDDFITVHAHEAGCKINLDRLVALFKILGLPMAVEKIEGPFTIMVFLGILINTINMTMSLDAERLKAIEDMLASWAARKQASRQELQSLIGILSFAAKVVRASRIFLRRMIDQLKLIPSWANATTQYLLSQEFFLDLKWWATFVRAWNGKAIIATQVQLDGYTEIFTDACVPGYGAVYDNEWFAGTWTAEEAHQARVHKRDSMPWKELHCIVRAAATWGKHWAGKHIMLRCDCEPVVLA